MTATLDGELAELRRGYAELQRILDERTRERDEALDRETATGDVLNVINSSPGDLVPVFDTILQKAIRLCEAAFGILWTYDGELFHAVAFCNVPPLYAELFREPHRAGPLTGLGRVAGGEPFAHITDMLEDDAYRTGDPVRRAGIDLAGARTHLSVPLRKDGVLVGNFAVFRKEVRPFTDKQIALVQNFAVQAVIAMENTRLLGDLRQRTSDLQESLEYQTATSDVLKVISRSTFNLQPVLDTLAETAARLCDAGYSAIFRRDGEVYRVAAVVAFSPETTDAARKFQTFLEQHPLVPGRGSITGRVVLEGRAVHVADTAHDPEYTLSEATTLGNLRTQLGVPLLREGEPVGVIVVARQRVEPFTARQVGLVHTFADQAVIAMENARLITEIREALEQQTATAEVLRVINSSPGKLQPVFEAILEKAHSLCGVSYGSLQLYDGEKFRAIAVHGLSGVLAERLRQGYSPGRTHPVRRLVNGERFVHTPDLAEIDDPIAKSIVELGGTRTLLWVALRKDEKLLGLIAAARLEVRPFSDKHIALLENFAAQAVIAMENARLITETREALEQQTATAEVLGVINSSPGDLAPVFDATLERATRLSDAAFGVMQVYDGEQFRTVATRSMPPALAEFLLHTPRQPTPHSAVSRILDGEDFVHFEDMTSEQAYLSGDLRQQAFVELGGTRTYVAVALRKDGRLLGTIGTYRQEVRPFTDKQIALLQNFAAQAVIAMENARLITETQEALEQQTATAEVLSVINSSPGELTPVFQAMLEKALRLCGATFGVMNRYDGEYFHHAADQGVPSEYAKYRRERGPTIYGPGTTPARLVAGESLVHTADLMATEVYERGDPARRALVDLGGARTHLTVALQKGAVLLGDISIYRQDVRPFSGKQIALLQNFAAQAVIAMENARLITETREALEQQTATAEVLQVINSSPGEIAPVFNAMLEKAMRLCGAEFGEFLVTEGEQLRAIAVRGVPATFAEFRHRNPAPPIPGSITARILTGEPVIHVADVKDDDLYRRGDLHRRALVDLGGARTFLSVTLIKDRAVLGSINIYRQEVRPFSGKQIALLQSFAAQAVIAMENARLITETREALERQTATAEVLQVINSSPGDLQPVFDAMLDKALGLCEADFGVLWTYDGERIHATALRGVPPTFAEFLTRTPHSVGPDNAHGRLLRGEPVVHIADVAEDKAYSSGDPIRRTLVELGGGRTLVAVPLRKDETFLGDFVIYRQEVRRFSEKQIGLLQNFAAQAVIAIENARLLDEIRQRQAELRVTFDNMADGVIMFDEDLRLAAWNRNFQQILDLPDALLKERPSYAEYLRILANRGEFGTDDIEAELSRRLADTNQELRFERTRPDGRVIEVRRNSVPDGGFVLIYSDITERKRSEAEIRAARDGAEAAYRDLKAAQANLIQVEKMASLGQLTAGIAHEIKNPLNFVNNFAGLSVELLDELKEAAAPAITALDEDKRAEIDETIEMLTGNLEKITEHGRRADNIVKSMLEHSRGSSGEQRSVDLNALIEEALNLAYHGGRAQDQSFNVTLEREYAEALPSIEIVPQDITRVCLNLFTNGFYATTKRQREGGDPNFKPTLKVSTRDLGEAVEVRIRDNGVGIPAEIKDKLFQPFFTTKPTGEGTGLGLSISYDIVTQQHGGAIEVDSRVGEYTEFTVRLPRRHRTILGEAAS